MSAADRTTWACLLVAAALVLPRSAAAGPAPRRLVLRAQAECGALVDRPRVAVTLDVRPGAGPGPTVVRARPGQGVLGRCVTNVVRLELDGAAPPRRSTHWTFRLRPVLAGAVASADAAAAPPARRIVGVDRSLDPSFKRFADAAHIAVAAVDDDPAGRALADALRARQAPLVACFAEFGTTTTTTTTTAPGPGPVVVEARWSGTRWDLHLGGASPALDRCLLQVGAALPAPAATASDAALVVTLQLAPGAT